jgi:hypothetical protein
MDPYIGEHGCGHYSGDDIKIPKDPIHHRWPHVANGVGDSCPTLCMGLHAIVHQFLSAW